MNIIEKVLNSESIKSQPPVLVDIGASGKIHKQWKSIARHSICLAFDADEREFGYITKESSGFKKLFIYNCIVSNQDSGESDFYLTKSPYCSSLLKPDNEALKVWSFSEKFKVEQVIKLKTKSLSDVLKELDLNYVDWFKTDSQGTDLRLFKSLPESTRKKVLAAEFEPGIIDSYVGEDKMYEVLRYMESEDFWLSGIKVKGTPRITNEVLNRLGGKGSFNRMLNFSLKSSPGWAEMIYLNKLSTTRTERELLLGWVFSIINEQYGFALEISDKLPDNSLTKEMRRYVLSKIKTGIIKMRFIPAVFQKIASFFQK